MKVNHADPAAVAAVAADILRTHAIMVIATADLDNQPWAVPVHQITLSDGRMTWRSDKATRHSQNLVANPKASATLYSASREAGEISIFLEGTVQVITEPADLKVIIDRRYGAKAEPSPVPEDFLGEASYRMYTFTPTAAWINDDSHTKVAVDLSLLN